MAVFGLIKFLEDEKAVESFRLGKMRFTQLKSFNEQSFWGDRQRFDKNEGTFAHCQPKNITLKIGGHTIPEKDLAGPVRIQYEQTKELFAMSLHSLNSGRWIEIHKHEKQKFQQSLLIDKRNFEFGDRAIFILDTTEYISRMEKAISNAKWISAKGLVQYYRSDEHIFESDYVRAAFQKEAEKYAHQREYRFVVQPTDLREKVIWLDIGNLEDITLEVSSSDINPKLEVRFK